MAITREDIINQSMQEYVRQQIFNVRNYPQDQIEILNAYPHNRFEGRLDKNYIAVGFDYDDEGRAGEVGSDLTIREYSIELFIFGISPVWGRNLANAVKFSLDKEKVLPLLDISQIGKPHFDNLPILGVSAAHQIVPKPQPFEENVWVVSSRVEDTYYARLV